MKRGVGFLLCGLMACSAFADEAANKKSELQALKQRLHALQQDFRATQAQRAEAADSLRASERAISEAVRQLRELDSARSRTHQDLQSLMQEAEAAAARIRQQQTQLAQSLNAAYRQRQDDALKLLLNGADPNQTARDLHYLTRLTRARHGLVERLRIDHAQLLALQNSVAQKSESLSQLQAARASEQRKLELDKRARETVLSQLSSQIKTQRHEIATLQRDERSLTQLVERLNRLMVQQAAREAANRARVAQQAKAATRQPGKSKPDLAERAPSRLVVGVNTQTPEAFVSDQPFSRLKGGLRLPVAGELLNRFGAPREGGGLSWKGLFIRATPGAAVKAIAAGQVVFSEWLRGFGNLIIVDHGEGYMSLYSNNESLYKQVGERVRPGDAIASVGNSGGQPDAGLYFEMRHQSRPVNPLLWVK
ncbi:MAG: peptidoglycan DD-metalloendopeptidase family protein [Thiobacillus sp.]